MKKFIFGTLALFGTASCTAADLGQFGLENIAPITAEAATTVRGLGGSTYVNSIGTSSMAFSIADTKSGSVFNLNATSQLSGYDSVDFVSADSGTQAVGNSSVGGIQFGSASFDMAEFEFSMDGFSAVTQSQQAGGAGSGLDFSGLLP